MAVKSDNLKSASTWAPVMNKSTNPAAILAAELAREGRGFYRAPVEIARDAEALVALAAKLCEPGRSKRSVAAYVARAAEVGRPYGAEIVTDGELEGCVIGLRFTRSRYGRPGSIFAIA